MSIPKEAGKAAYQAALRKVKLPNIWNSAHQSAFLVIKVALMLDPVLKAPCFDGTPFIVTSDGCQEGFGVMLTQMFTEMKKGGTIVKKHHPIMYASKRISPSKAKYKPFLMEFTALKFGLDKFNNIIWGLPVQIKMDSQALRDVLLNDKLNASHSHWRDGGLAHQIVDVHHIPGQTNLVGDGLSRKD